MVHTHVVERLASLADGQLDTAETARVTAHLAGCARCQAARERHAFAAAMLRGLPLVSAPASVWSSVEHALDAAPHPAADLTALPRSLITPPRRGFWRPALALAAAVALVAVSLVIWQARQGGSPWDVVRLDAPGRPTPMAAGEWIETDAASRAMIQVGAIGTVEIAPNTRIQLVTARADEHRLNLARGMISAEIVAPPRLFFVETPASTVVDLGCAYTMEVDAAGVGTLRVTSGWASLEWSGRESLVPAGASCPTRPAVGPGTPSFDDASARLREVLLAFDFASGGREALEIVLAEARPRDTLTLWHLLSRVAADERVRVFDRMVALTPLPPGVAREKALALDADTLRIWREELAWTW